MAGPGSPYIKSEPTDFNFQNNFQQSSPFNMNPHHMQNGMNGGDHAMSNSNFNSAFAPQNMSSSFNMGNSGIADDELLDGINMDDAQHNPNFPQGQYNNGNMNQHYLNQGSVPMSMNQQHINTNNLYSSTPEGAPIQSPYLNEFNYSQFRPHQFSVPTTGAYANGLNAPQMHHQMERKISDSRSPATPNTPGIATLHLGESEYPASSMGQQPRAIMGHRHSSSMNNWENVSNPHSWQDVSPFGSPSNPMMPHQQHPQITEVLKSSSGGNTKIASSLPAKMENPPAFQTQEAKRKRRRESHNLVERRRRDNINERIQDLASLVPQHRLEDERVRKHLQTNAPLSPSIAASGMSPPQATSLLAGGNGRRATTGSAATIGLPMDDKDKGPNKGDILNGSVAWTRDLLWFMKRIVDENDELKNALQARGQEWPSNLTEDERRMSSEVREIIQKNFQSGNLQGYSRGHGSGLRVPGFTTLAGEPLQSQEGQFANSNSLSPGFQNGSGGISPAQNYWQSADEPVFKEEDEFVINDL